MRINTFCWFSTKQFVRNKKNKRSTTKSRRNVWENARQINEKINVQTSCRRCFSPAKMREDCALMGKLRYGSTEKIKMKKNTMKATIKCHKYKIWIRIWKNVQIIMTMMKYFGMRHTKESKFVFDVISTFTTLSGHFCYSVSSDFHTPRRRMSNARFRNDISACRTSDLFTASRRQRTRSHVNFQSSETCGNAIRTCKLTGILAYSH